MISKVVTKLPNKVSHRIPFYVPLVLFSLINSLFSGKPSVFILIMNLWVTVLVFVINIIHKWRNYSLNIYKTQNFALPSLSLICSFKWHLPFFKEGGDYFAVILLLLKSSSIIQENQTLYIHPVSITFVNSSNHNGIKVNNLHNE